MRFNPYLFDLDNSLLYIPNAPRYFDNILVETIKNFTKKKIPSLEERNTFWSSGEQYLDLLHQWGVDIDNGEFFWKKFDALDFEQRKVLIEKRHMALFSDVIEVLSTLKQSGKHLALISNTARYIVNYVVKEYDLEQYFNIIFGLGYGKEQALAKPSPDGIKYILKKSGFYKNNANPIMIGDSKVDVIAAKRADIHACLLKRDTWENTTEINTWECKPDYIIESLEDLLNL
ncbi:MAG: putative Pyrophosphatase PpaX [Promethearchaeota archaeon]|nr:MAG: putative Pyrophosphatase PpaX [Candidatus Lokiarchaeota archaeon]